MRIKSALLGVMVSLGLLVAFAYAQMQSDPGTQQSGRSSSEQQMNQQGAMTQDPQTVKQVQQALSDKGYYKGAADGKWSSKTESALKKFQKAEGMPETGQLNQQTLASLGISGSAAGGQQDMSSGQSGAGGQQGGMQEQPGGQMKQGQQGGSKY